MSTIQKPSLFNGVKNFTKVRVTVVQSSAVYNDTPATLVKAEKYIEEAAKDKAELVVFPEGFVGGYPRGFRFGMAVGVHNVEGRDEFCKYHASAIQVPGPEVERLAKAARKNNVYMVMGAIEKDGYTLYCTALFFSPQGEFLGKHRKLMPTGMERCIWGQGDGSTIPVYDTPIGKIGAALCWESKMPLYRTALYAKGIEIYCAPTAYGFKDWQSSMMHIALEGGCFVLSAGLFGQRKDFPEDPDYLFADFDDNKGPDAIVSQGGSVIISPLGEVLAGPIYDSEALVTATLDLGDIARAKLYFDVVGHYSRPDVLHLTVNEHPKKSVTFLSKVEKPEDETNKFYPNLSVESHMLVVITTSETLVPNLLNAVTGRSRQRPRNKQPSSMTHIYTTSYHLASSVLTNSSLSIKNQMILQRFSISTNKLNLISDPILMAEEMYI